MRGCIHQRVGLCCCVGCRGCGGGRCEVGGSQRGWMRGVEVRAWGAGCGGRGAECGMQGCRCGLWVQGMWGEGVQM